MIFDVDGTLYDQRKLRRYMFLELLKYSIMNPMHLKALKILKDFRREREKHIFDVQTDIENAQYNWGARASGVSAETVRSVVEKWIFKVPLKYILHCRYSGLIEFVANLSNRGIPTAVFSDYPAKEKVLALGLSPRCIVCSTDKNVDKMKPDTRGLFVIAETLGLAVEKCLFIGDRDERDGECARKAGMPYLILNRARSRTDFQFQTYHELNEQLNQSVRLT